MGLIKENKIVRKPKKKQLSTKKVIKKKQQIRSRSGRRERKRALDQGSVQKKEKTFLFLCLIVFLVESAFSLFFFTFLLSSINSHLRCVYNCQLLPESGQLKKLSETPNL